MPEELEPVPCPEEVEYLWFLFIRLSARRTFSEMYGGPTCLSILEVKAWLDLNQLYLEPYEIELLFALDDAYMKYAATRKANRNG